MSYNPEIMEMTPRRDDIELGRPFEQPVGRYGERHSIPVALQMEVPYTAAEDDEFWMDIENFAPEVPREVSPEAYNPTEVVLAIDGCAARDLEAFGVPALLDIEFAAAKALEAYDVSASDTTFAVEQAVAEYFAAVTNKILEIEDVSDAQVERFVADVTRFVNEADSRDKELAAS